MKCMESFVNFMAAAVAATGPLMMILLLTIYSCQMILISATNIFYYVFSCVANTVYIIFLQAFRLTLWVLITWFSFNRPSTWTTLKRYPINTIFYAKKKEQVNIITLHHTIHLCDFFFFLFHFGSFKKRLIYGIMSKWTPY